MLESSCCFAGSEELLEALETARLRTMVNIAECAKSLTIIRMVDAGLVERLRQS